MKEIKAISGNHALLADGKVPVIGYLSLTEQKQYVKGGCMLPTLVCFHFNTEYKDYFYFENMDKLAYNSVSFKTPEYITNVYQEIVKMDSITPKEFIRRVREAYVFRKMGFTE